MCPVLHRPGHVDNGFDAVGATEQQRVFADGVFVLTNGVLEPLHRVHPHDLIRARVFVSTLGLGKRAVGDGDEFHARNRVENLVGEASRHKARADHCDAERLTGFGSFLEGGIDDNHETASGFSNRPQAASLAEMTVTSIGHSMSNAGSS